MSGFDPVAERYDELMTECVRPSGFAPDYFHARKAQALAAALRRYHPCVPDAPRVLDYGCGIGSCDPFLRRELPQAHILGVDVSAVSIDHARRRNAVLTGCSYAVLEPDGELPAGSLLEGPFDAILIANVLHHVAPPLRAALLARLAALLAPQGVLCIVEHNPVNPLTRRAVARCPFDGDAVLLGAAETRTRVRAAGLRLRALRYIVFFPGWLAPLVPLERWLAGLPFGAQYVAVGQRATEAR